MIACFVLTLGLGITNPCAGATNAVGRLRSALQEMHRWVDDSPHGKGWRAHLRSQQLQSQLAKGPKADPEAVRQILDRYSSGAPGLELPQFVKVRQALTRWLAELSPPSIDQLPARVRAAKSRFVPLTKAELRRARSRLLAALRRLDAELTAAGPDGEDWKAYLRWDALQSELARGGDADLSKLDEAYYKYDSGHEGLDLVCFSDVRRALRDYLTAARALDVPQLKDHYEALMDALADHLKSVHKVPTAEETAGIIDAVGWLRDARQADPLIREIRRCFSQPNLLAQLSADLVRAGVDRPVDDTSPVVDVILGTDVRGTGRTTGRLSAELVPNRRQAEIALVFRGMAESDTVGSNGPARIYSDGVTKLLARKTLRIDARGVQPAPATAEAQTSTTITGIGLVRGGGLVERVAWKRVCSQKAEADRIAGLHAEERINGRLNEEVTQTIRKSKDKPVGRSSEFLGWRAWFPGQFRLSTTRDVVRLVAVEASSSQLASPVPAPPLAGEPDLGIRLHESMVNNWSARALPGLILTEQRLQATAFEILGRHLQELQPDEDGEPWTISFAYRQPIFISFGDGEFRLTIRGRSYAKGEDVYPAMDVTAKYRIEKTDQGPKAVRQGDLQAFPPGFVPGSGQRLSLREQLIRDLLQRRFEKILPKEIVPKPLKLPKPWDSAGEMVLTQWETREGWMVLAWNRASSANRTPPAGPAR
ncbi:MAG TPA: hypothetical protein VNA25_12895 [Phycisphaerae bacterium]|nr:hypothetical protein [Phycisphaerae bacterium]